jgi:hypothetical protein
MIQPRRVLVLFNEPALCVDTIGSVLGYLERTGKAIVKFAYTGPGANGEGSLVELRRVGLLRDYCRRMNFYFEALSEDANDIVRVHKSFDTTDVIVFDSSPTSPYEDIVQEVQGSKPRLFVTHPCMEHATTSSSVTLVEFREREWELSEIITEYCLSLIADEEASPIGPCPKLAGIRAPSVIDVSDNALLAGFTIWYRGQ